MENEIVMSVSPLGTTEWVHYNALGDAVENEAKFKNKQAYMRAYYREHSEKLRTRDGARFYKVKHGFTDEQIETLGLEEVRRIVRLRKVLDIKELPKMLVEYLPSIQDEMYEYKMEHMNECIECTNEIQPDLNIKPMFLKKRKEPASLMEPIAPPIVQPIVTEIVENGWRTNSNGAIKIEGGKISFALRPKGF